MGKRRRRVWISAYRSGSGHFAYTSFQLHTDEPVWDHWYVRWHSGGAFHVCQSRVREFLGGRVPQVGQVIELHVELGDTFYWEK